LLGKEGKKTPLPEEKAKQGKKELYGTVKLEAAKLVVDILCGRIGVFSMSRSCDDSGVTNMRVMVCIKSFT
jgi:hypothetical protein